MTRKQRIQIKRAQRIKAFTGTKNQITAFTLYDETGKTLISYPDQIHKIAPEELFSRIITAGKFIPAPRRINQTVREFIRDTDQVPTIESIKEKLKPAPVQFVPKHIQYR